MTAEDQPSIGFICPSYTEVKAVLATFDKGFSTVLVNGTKYSYGLIRGRKTVAVTLPHDESGPVAASRCAAELLKKHPSLKKDGSYCFLVGIAGGIWSQDNDVRLGDIVIATSIWDRRLSRTTSEGFVSTEHRGKAPQYLLLEIGQFLYDRSELEVEIQNTITQMQNRSKDKRWKYPGLEKDVLYEVDYHHLGADTCDECEPEKALWRPRRSTTNSKVHDGLVASGDTVPKTPVNRKQLQEANALAVDMEACGMPENFVVIRGISDYADSHKNDVWQPYAAAAAAACARLIIDTLDKDMDGQTVTHTSQEPSHLMPRMSYLLPDHRSGPQENGTLSSHRNISRISNYSTRSMGGVPLPQPDPEVSLDNPPEVTHVYGILSQRPGPDECEKEIASTWARFETPGPGSLLWIKGSPTVIKKGSLKCKDGGLIGEWSRWQTYNLVLRPPLLDLEDQHGKLKRTIPLQTTTKLKSVEEDKGYTFEIKWLYYVAKTTSTTKAVTVLCRADTHDEKDDWMKTIKAVLEGELIKISSSVHLGDGWTRVSECTEQTARHSQSSSLELFPLSAGAIPQTEQMQPRPLYLTRNRTSLDRQEGSA